MRQTDRVKSTRFMRMVNGYTLVQKVTRYDQELLEDNRIVPGHTALGTWIIHNRQTFGVERCGFVRAKKAGVD